MKMPHPFSLYVYSLASIHLLRKVWSLYFRKKKNGMLGFGVQLVWLVKIFRVRSHESNIKDSSSYFEK